jgi:hypothetical protein
MSIVLPKKKIKVTNKNPRKFILYSQPKMGKTTVLSQLDNCLIIDLENGSDFVDALKVKANNLKEFYEIGESIKEEGKPYKYVAIDTITKLENWCEETAKNMYKKTPMGKKFNGESVLTLPNGGGYLYLRLAFEQWLDYASSLAEHVIFVGHLKNRLIEQKGKEVNAKDLDLTGKIASITAANADAIGYLYRTPENNLKINFQAKDELIAGSRCEHLKGKDIDFDWSKIYID